MGNLANSENTECGISSGSTCIVKMKTIFSDRNISQHGNLTPKDT